MIFVDRVQVKVKGGDGGNGCISFRREKYVAKGGPDGGDGGDGGSVIFEATQNEQSLVALKYMNHYEGERGQHGMGKQRYGRAGKDVLVYVPVGTLVKDANDPASVLVDLDTPGQRFVAAQGGKGGFGNLRFVSSVNRAPRQANPGLPGEERELELELKIIADAGLVGYPNAGKSTLLGAITNANPETGPYPFTTTSPNVGILVYEDFARLTIADIPGLIDGAHLNVGLGHGFLRHIERTKALIYVLDMAGTDNRSPIDDFDALRHELECHQAGLSSRPSLIAANKMDGADAAQNLAMLRQHTELPIFPICAVLNEGTGPLTKELRRLVPCQAV